MRSIHYLCQAKASVYKKHEDKKYENRTMSRSNSTNSGSKDGANNNNGGSSNGEGSKVSSILTNYEEEINQFIELIELTIIEPLQTRQVDETASS